MTHRLPPQLKPIPPPPPPMPSPRKTNRRKKKKNKAEEEPLIPLPCDTCNEKKELACVHQSCHDTWMLADVKYASCPRCRTPANITREKINEIRMRKGLPVEKTVTNFLSFTLHLQPRPAPSSHLNFSLFQSLCWNCNVCKLVSVFYKHRLSITSFVIIAVKKMYFCHCGSDRFHYTFYTVTCLCPKRHIVANITYICNFCNDKFNNSV